MCKEEYLFQLGSEFCSEIELALMTEVEGCVALPTRATVYLCSDEPVVLTHVAEGDNNHPVVFRTSDGKYVLFEELSTDDVLTVAQALSGKFDTVDDALREYEQKLKAVEGVEEQMAY